MKKLLLIICGSVLLLSGCSAKTEPLLESGKLRVAVTPEIENAEEIAEYIARQLEAPLEIIKTDCDTAVQMLSNESADIAVGGFSNYNDPGLMYKMTLPIAENRIYIVCDSDDFFVNSSDLTGRTLGADADLPQSVLNSLMTTTATEKFFCDNAKEAAEMLKSGDIQAYVCYEDEAFKLISENESLSCCVPADIEMEQYSIVLQKDDTELFGAVNCAVAQMITGVI